MRALFAYVWLLLSVAILTGGEVQANGGLTLEQAIRKAVLENPRVGEASANRRATDFELRQVQGGLLPQIRVQAEFGNERYRRFDGVRVSDTNNWRKAGNEASIVVSQLLFDGFATINQIYRQMARSDAAAWRAHERAELVALDTAEAYLEVIRYSRSLAHADQNVQVHERLANNIGQRFSGGRAGRGDQEQVRERLAAAKAVQAELMIRLEESKAAFRRAVGIVPSRLAGASRLSGLPKTREQAFSLTIAGNPTLRAATSDVTAAEREFDASAGSLLPRLSVEGRVKGGRDSSNYLGNFDESSVKLRMDMAIFTGGTDTARREELAERVGESRMRMDSLRRAAFESVDRAWGVRANSGARISALQAQVAAAEQVVAAYRGEYELGQRSLLDLLNAENGLFNAKLSLEAARSVAVFADYQLLATSGTLLARLNVPKPGTAVLLAPERRGVLPTTIGNPLPNPGNPMRGALN